MNPNGSNGVHRELHTRDKVGMDSHAKDVFFSCWDDYTLMELDATCVV